MLKSLESIEIVLKDGYRRVAFKINENCILTYNKMGDILIGDINLTNYKVVGHLDADMGFGKVIENIVSNSPDIKVEPLAVRKALLRFYGVMYCEEPINYRSYNKIRFNESMNCYSLDFGRGEVLTGSSNKFVVMNGYDRNLIAVKVCNKENLKLIEELCIRMNITNSEIMEVKNDKTILHSLLETLYENSMESINLSNLMIKPTQKYVAS